MRCNAVQARLQAYVDDLLSPAERAEVDAHTSACGECRAELEGWDRALDALRCATPASGPDLWSSFQQRLAVERAPLTCAQAGELLPALGEELSRDEERDLAAHLAACGGCREEEARLAHSLRALDAAREFSAPDLWPAFVTRLERERAAAPFWRSWLAPLRSLAAPNAWARPALALSVALAAFVALRGLAPGTPPAREAVRHPVAPIVENSRPQAGPVLKHEAMVAAQPAAPRPGHAVRTVRIARAEAPRIRRRSRRTERAALRIARMTPAVAPAAPRHTHSGAGLTRMAMQPRNAPAEPFGAPDVTTADGVGNASVKQAAQAEVVHAVELLAGLEDATRRPFEMDQDAR